MFWRKNIDELENEINSFLATIDYYQFETITLASDCSGGVIAAVSYAIEKEAK